MKLNAIQSNPLPACSSVLPGAQFVAIVLTILSTVSALAQAGAEKPNPNEELRTGKSYLPTRVYSEQEDQRLLAVFDGLRVADVSDGMDAVGLHNTGLMNADIRPLWKDTEKFTHRFIGIAVTARYVPTQNPPAGLMKTPDYDKWAGDWYKNKSSEPFVPLLRRGSALVIEDAAEAAKRYHLIASP